MYDVKLTKNVGVSDFGKEEELAHQRTVWSILAGFAPVSWDLIFSSSHFQKLLTREAELPFSSLIPINLY